MKYYTESFRISFFIIYNCTENPACNGTVRDPATFSSQTGFHLTQTFSSCFSITLEIRMGMKVSVLNGKRFSPTVDEIRVQGISGEYKEK
jgi:hypothetical protein